MEEMGLKELAERKPTPTLVRKSIWTLSEEHLNLEQVRRSLLN